MQLEKKMSGSLIYYSCGDEKEKEKKKKKTGLFVLFSPEAVHTDNCHLLDQVIHVKTGELTGFWPDKEELAGLCRAKEASSAGDTAEWAVAA